MANGVGARIGTVVFFCAVLWTAAIAKDGSARQTEATFLSAVSVQNIGGYIQDMTAHPDFPGSAWDKRNAEKTLQLFKSWGLDAHIETFAINFPTPAERVVELVAPVPFKAALHEPAFAEDSYSKQRSEQMPAYFVYGPDGDVTAPLIYVNYGLREDYDALARLGVSVKDAVIIIRAGRMWRGGKVQLAAEHGAKAVLIYSDPQQDGYYRGPVYPDGGWRSADSVQRGSILNGTFDGDPLRPFAGPRAGEEVAPEDPASSMARIPAMPLSYADAEPLLKALGGPTVPEDWRGALPLTYRAGPGSALLHMKIRYRWNRILLYDVVATIKGSTYPNEWLVRGNHRDGWVYGAQDPHSGHSAMLEEARILGLLSKQGWRPKRTIIYASWDAEEQGTIGSALWVESHLAELKGRAVAYINTDVTGPGALRLGGAASFTDFLTQIAAEITDPNSGVSALERLRIKTQVLRRPRTAGGSSGALGLEDDGFFYDLVTERLKLEAPGYGSDHHAFVSHAGVPSLLLEFGDQTNLGSYHSIYDNFAWYSRFGDPGFRYGRATAQFNGLAVLRLAAADIIPQRFGATARALKSEVDGLEALYAAARRRGMDDQQDLELHATEVLQDPANPRLPPVLRAMADLDLKPLERAVAAVERAAIAYDTLADATAQVQRTRSNVLHINEALMLVERAFLRPGGLPERPYYGNELYAPGRLWDTVPLPAIGDAILDDHWVIAGQQIPEAAATLLRISSAIAEATERLRVPPDRRQRKACCID